MLKLKKQFPITKTKPKGSVRKSLKVRIQSIIKEFESDTTQLVAILREIQSAYRCISDRAITIISEELDIPRVHVEGAATFYHFFSKTHRGEYTVYLNTSTTSEMAGSIEVEKAFFEAVGVEFGRTTSDNLIGLYKTSCIGMCDQEPAAIINDVVFTRLNTEKVKKLVRWMKSRRAIEKFRGANKVENKIQQGGVVFFGNYIPGKAIKKALELGSLEVIEEIKKSGLRGRGGAGFPTGQKWAMCRGTESDARYVICNTDEGEPGTFKDRALLTERAPQVFEGMVIAGYAIESKHGILYLRGEYFYLLKHLENELLKMRKKNLLGRRILGTRFSFDIQIKVGAGAYICGEESALIESVEGKRGEPRNRPPFPVTAGYLHKPTVVNNPETLGASAQIVLNGSLWFKKLGTSASAGVKLLSISGDCKKPGIYEVEWGLTVRDVLKLCQAEDVLAVQVGGPSGVCVSENQFDRKICYSDLATGGAITVFSKKRDLFSIVHNHMEFFAKESCGFCVPCRAGNVLLLKALEKIMVGNGTSKDIEGIKELGRMVKTASRCGLGQSSPNPLLTSLDNFSEQYRGSVAQNIDYLSQFNLEFAVADSFRVAGRKPNLEIS